MHEFFPKKIFCIDLIVFYLLSDETPYFYFFTELVRDIVQAMLLSPNIFLGLL